MTIYYPDCAAVPTPTCSDCPPKELGGIRSVWFQKQTFSFIDISDPAEWTAGILSGDLIILPKTRGSLEMAEFLENGFGDIPQSLGSYDITLTFFDPNFIGSCAFYNAIKNSTTYLVGWRTESKVYLSAKPALFIPKAPVSEDLKTRVVWNVMAKFTQEDIPCPLDMPVGTFDRCIAA